MVEVGFEDNAGANGVGPTGAVIKVIGVGGGGGNAVKNMSSAIEGIEFICANTDAQALHSITSAKKLQLGANLTKGLGAGADPEKGREAANEDRKRIEEMLSGTDMLFITTGMGGGTGTGATPVIAKIAKDMGILTVAVVTKPFLFEGKKRSRVAEEGIEELRKSVDSLITIPNAKLQELMGKDAALTSAFAKADDVLAGAVRGISDIIKRPGMINVDFADVKAVMSGMGLALMGTGCASGPNRAAEATEAAVKNPLLAGVDLKGARGILVNITAGPDLTLGEYSDVGSVIDMYSSEEATVKIGSVIDPNMRDELHVTVVATGLNEAITHEVRNDVHRIPAIPPSQVAEHTPAHRHQTPAPAPVRTPQPTQFHDQAPVRQDSVQVGGHSYQAEDNRVAATMAQEPAHAYHGRQREQVRDQVAPKAHHGHQAADMDYLDIPAFLRQQGQGRPH